MGPPLGVTGARGRTTLVFGLECTRSWTGSKTSWQGSSQHPHPHRQGKDATLRPARGQTAMAIAGVILVCLATRVAAVGAPTRTQHRPAPSMTTPLPSMKATTCVRHIQELRGPFAC